MKNLTLIIPAKNEEYSLPKVLEEIKNIVALVFSKNQNKKLYFFIHINAECNVDQIKMKINDHIKNNFPFYMVPSGIFFVTNDFPRNTNSKVDKIKLINDYIINE